MQTAMAVGDPVVADTSALYALHCPDDVFHERAWIEYRRLMESLDSLWVTSYTLVETVALLHRRLGFRSTQDFERWRERSVRVLWVGESTHVETWRLYASQQGQGMNFVDCSTAIAAREMGAVIFTFDSDFGRRGWPVTP